MARKLRFAVVGQGYFAQSAILPAFAHTKRSELTALFSDDAAKLRALKRKYGVPHALPYDQLDGFLDGGAVDAVYIALPNDMHAAYTERAARAGVHVLCEKPIAASSAEAERMIAACARARVKLMIGYRLHFEEANLSAIEAIKRGDIGEPRFFSSVFSQQVAPGNTRTHGARAGGPLRDVGVYCINAARYLFQDEPTEVTAFAGKKAGDARFDEVDEQIAATLRFPGDRLAQLTCSFGAYDQSSYTVVGDKGMLRLSPAYDVSSKLELEVTAGGNTKRKRFKPRDQVAAEIDELAACVLEDREPEPSGREGLADISVIEAIEAAIRSGGRARVSRVFPHKRPSIRQTRKVGSPSEPDLIDARPPTLH